MTFLHGQSPGFAPERLGPAHRARSKETSCPRSVRAGLASGPKTTALESVRYCELKGGRGGSNSRHSAWKADVLPLNDARGTLEFISAGPAAAGGKRAGDGEDCGRPGGWVGTAVRLISIQRSTPGVVVQPPVPPARVARVVETLPTVGAARVSRTPARVEPETKCVETQSEPGTPRPKPVKFANVAVLATTTGCENEPSSAPGAPPPSV